MYVDVVNNSGHKAMFFTHQIKLVQNRQQLEAESTYEQGYPEIQSEILKGVTSSGIIVFQAIPESGALELHIEAYNEDYSLEFEPYVFQVNY